MKKHPMPDGKTVLIQTRSPYGDGFVVYATGGKEGMVQVIDTNMTPPDMIAAALSMVLGQYQDRQPANPHLDFEPPTGP